MPPVEEPPPDLFSVLHPAPNALLDLLRGRIDDAMLSGIAGADYGQEYGEHLRALRSIRDTGRVPVPFEWCPQEVLSLTRWWKPGQTSDYVTSEAEGHLVRAFSCSALLRGAAEPGNADFDFGERDALARALSSAAALGADVERAALQFLAWQSPLQAPDEPGRGWSAIGLAMLVVHLGGASRDQDWLERLGWWVVGRAEGDGLGSGGAYNGLDYDIWQELALRMWIDIEALPHGGGRSLMEEVSKLIV